MLLAGGLGFDNGGVEALPHDDQYILNHCTKYLARVDFDLIPVAELSEVICESWRFPVIDSHPSPASDDVATGANRVTFIHAVQGPQQPANVTVVGTFAPLYTHIPLRRVQFLGENTRFWGCSFVVPFDQVHTYTFFVDGVAACDPVNPQRVRLDNNQLWSRFFTHYCTQPLTLTPGQAALLQRMTDQILPFHTTEGQRFLDRYVQQLSATGTAPVAGLYRLQEPVGVVNFIDNLLAREEHHHRVDYEICLRLIDQILRQRGPNSEPCELEGSGICGAVCRDGDRSRRRVGLLSIQQPPLLPSVVAPACVYRRVCASQIWRERRRRGLGVPGAALHRRVRSHIVRLVARHRAPGRHEYRVLRVTWSNRISTQ